MAVFINPEAILDQLDLREGQMVAEFGCGSGGFTIPLAKRLKGGRVYALDIQEEALSALQGRKDMEGLFNIEVRRCDLEAPEGSTLPRDFLDLVLIPDVLFQVDNKAQLLKEAKRILKIGGKILVIDWLPNTSLSPKYGCISPEDLQKIAESFKLKLEKELEAGKYHYGLVFVKL